MLDRVECEAEEGEGMKFYHHRWHKHARHRAKCINCGAPTCNDKRVRYCAKCTHSKGTKIKGYNELGQVLT